jgi:coproporphyrinogen III oxidase
MIWKIFSNSLSLSLSFLTLSSSFVKGCGEALVPQYIPIMKKRMNMPFTQAQKDWQQIRRGRYVEFNLVCDNYVVLRETDS